MKGKRYMDMYGGFDAIQERMRSIIWEQLSKKSQSDRLTICKDCGLDALDLENLLYCDSPIPFAIYERLSPSLGLTMPDILTMHTLTEQERVEVAADMNSERLFVGGAAAPPRERTYSPELYAIIRAVLEFEQITSQAPSIIAHFDLENVVEGSSLIEVVRTADEQLAEYCAANPKTLRVLEWREFENVIAEIMRGLGYEVELTAKTRDGGRDVIAVKSRPVAVRFLVECKHYAEQRPITIGAVRSLYGVVVDENATKGILATTSYFAAPAKQFIDRNAWRLEGRDWDGILDWLAIYHAAKK